MATLNQQPTLNYDLPPLNLNHTAAIGEHLSSERTGEDNAEDSKQIINGFLEEMSSGNDHELQEIISQAKMAINEYEYAEEEIKSSLTNLEAFSPDVKNKNASPG